MATEQGTPEHQDRGVPGVGWGVAIFLGGLILSVGIVVLRDTSKPLGDALAPAAQVLLAAVVAAFGVTQILISQAAMKAAQATVTATRDTVRATDAQTAVMQQDVLQARQEAVDSANRADEALHLARLERMDSDAPIAALVCNEVRFTDENGMHGSEVLELSSEDAEHRSYRYSGHATLINYGDLPLHWARSGTPDPELPHGGLQGLVLPNGSHKFYVNEPQTLAAWMRILESHRAEDHGPGFRHIEVTARHGHPYDRDVCAPDRAERRQTSCSGRQSSALAVGDRPEDVQPSGDEGRQCPR
jgi:hypothetical protein